MAMNGAPLVIVSKIISEHFDLTRYSIKHAPALWFTSIKSVAEVLSHENRALLHVIQDMKPESLKDLAEATGRKPSNLSRTLKTLAGYGFVELNREKKTVRPVAKTTEFEILAT